MRCIEYCLAAFSALLCTYLEVMLFPASFSFDFVEFFLYCVLTHQRHNATFQLLRTCRTLPRIAIDMSATGIQQKR